MKKRTRDIGVGAVFEEIDDENQEAISCTLAFFEIVGDRDERFWLPGIKLFAPPFSERGNDENVDQLFCKYHVCPRSDMLIWICIAKVASDFHLPPVFFSRQSRRESPPNTYE